MLVGETPRTSLNIWATPKTRQASTATPLNLVGSLAAQPLYFQTCSTATEVCDTLE